MIPEILPDSPLRMWITLDEYIFPGCYNTRFDIDEIFDSYQEEEGYDEKIYNFDSEKYLNEIAKIITSEINSFKVIEFNTFSPKTYNYQNDSINVLLEFTLEDLIIKHNSECPSDDINDMFNYIISEELYDLEEQIYNEVRNLYFYL